MRLACSRRWRKVRCLRGGGVSAEAVAHVYRKSPYSGLLLNIHLAIADSANDQYHYEFFMAQTNLSKKVRATREGTNRGLARLLKDGWLSIVEDGAHLPRGIVRYRFEFREDAPDVWAPRPRPVTTDHRSRVGEVSTCDLTAHDPVTTDHTELNRDPKADTGFRTGSSKAAAEDDEILSRDRLREHIGRARRDMRGG